MVMRFVLLALCWWPALLLAEVTVTIDRNPVQVNESFQLVFSLDHSPERDPDFSPLQKNFMVLGNTRSNSISIINGEYQRSVKWTLQLMAKQIGEYSIPAIRFDKERSKPFKVTVKPSTLSSLPHDSLVLELFAETTEVYVQSQVVVTLRLLSASEVTDHLFGKLEVSGLDAVIEPLGDTRRYRTRVADKSYLVLEKKLALFPQQVGRLEISPVLAEVRLPSTSGFDPFRVGGEVRSLRSNALSIDVDAIPAEFDAAYWLPANLIELREEWDGDPDQLVAGEPITRRLSLRAEGLTAAQLPELKWPSVDGIKQYPDQALLQNATTSKGINGQRVQNVALIPGAPGLYRLPEIRVPWWNLKSGRVEVATLPARALKVAPAPVANITPDSAAPASSEAEPVARAPAPGNRFWLGLSLALACGWALHATYWWVGARRRARRSQGSGPEHDESLRQARRRLRRACAENDAAAARTALLAWGRALLAPREVNNLGRLARMLGSEFEAEIERVNHSLYAPERAAWHGEDLWRLCRQLERSISPRRDDAPERLAPLNP